MIRRIIYYAVWLFIVAVLVFYSLKYKGGDEAMVAQVESQVTAISYPKPVFVKHVFVTPGQVVDSGDLLIEVERPDLKLDFERKITEKQQAENSIQEAWLVYQNSKKILEAKYISNRKVLINKKTELQHQLRMVENSRKRMDSVSSLSYTTSDSMRVKQVELIQAQIANLDYEYSIEKQQLLNRFENDTFRSKSELDIIVKELDELKVEKEGLQKRAKKRSTIGNLFVQLNELVPPYTNLLTLYDINPTLIKAFVQEQGVENLRIGTQVIVESVNRKYQIEGQIIEIGSRITAYPDKINPLLNQRSYGQEIFVNIPNDNDFLNGEKVFVYIVEDEK